MKKNKFLAVILAMAVAVGAAGVTTYAVGKDANDTEAPSAVLATAASDTEAVKDETVYVMTAADGSTQKILVSDWIKNALPAEAQKAIESLNDAQQVKDDCWTGTIQKELPVSMSIHYTLDGKTVTPSELAGKSGKVTIRFDYENHCTTTATVDGKEETLYVPFAALTGMLLDNEHTQQFIPQGLHKVNAHGVHSNGIKMVAVLSGSIILAQSFVPGAAAVLRQLTKLNSVCMPMRYLWVFAAYIALRNAYDTIPAEYRFVKNQAVAKFFGGWCFAVTAVCCVLGMYDKDPFTFALNVISPVVLTVLGFILPALAKREQTAAKK